jgi:hypothetical protein
VSILQLLHFVCNDSDTDGSSNSSNDGDSCKDVVCESNEVCNEGACQCDTGYILENKECINSKMAKCVNVAPENGHSIATEIEIFYSETDGWSLTGDCSWECDQNYLVDGDLCVDEGGSIPLNGFGDISGECGVFNEVELTSASSYVFINTIDFLDDPYDDIDYQYLSAGGQEIIDDGNAGGSSLISELFAYEVLYRCELAELIKTETEIIYDVAGKITDILVSIDGYKIGVSVTRAMTYPLDTPMQVSAAQSLLEGKLGDILESTANVSEGDRWVKQILSVVTERPDHVPVLQDAMELIDSSIKSDTLVYITVTEGADSPVY